MKNEYNTSYNKKKKKKCYKGQDSPLIFVIWSQTRQRLVCLLEFVQLAPQGKNGLSP